jgi:hypothetical protein
MTLREHEVRSRRKQVKRRSALAAPLSTLNDDQVMTFYEWCRLGRFSERTGRRILQSDSGPAVVQLSARRIGITVGANRLWQASKERA